MAVRAVSYYKENVLIVYLILHQTLTAHPLLISPLARESCFLAIADWLLQRFSFSYL